jgi:hypothetical protein
MTLQEAELADHTMDREISDEEWESARNAGEVQTWPHVPLSVLLECSTALSHISDAGFVYFIPAYMCAALDHLLKPQKMTENLLGSTVFHLTHTESAYSLSRLKAFSPRQVEAVIAFLSEVAATQGFTARHARGGLDSYWLTPRSREPLLYVP